MDILYVKIINGEPFNVYFGVDDGVASLYVESHDLYLSPEYTGKELKLSECSEAFIDQWLYFFTPKNFAFTLQNGETLDETLDETLALIDAAIDAHLKTNLKGKL